MTDLVGEVLCFRLGDEEFAVDIQHVQEIRSFEPPTPLPDAAGSILGCISLRGTIVPVVDLRRQLGLPKAAASKSEVTVVIRLGQNAIGIALDAVTEVIRPTHAQLRALPDLGPDVDQMALKGIVSIDGRLIILLDVMHLMRGLATSP